MPPTTILDGQYDLNFVLEDASLIGLMVAVDLQTGLPLYESVYAPQFPPRQLEGAAGYEQFDPLIDLPLAQDDWSAGIGAQDIRDDAPLSVRQVASLTNIELLPHHAILAPLVNAMTGAGATSTPDFFINTVGGTLVMFSGTGVYTLGASGAWTTAAVTLGAAISGPPVQFRVGTTNYIFVPEGSSTAYQYSSDNFATATASNLADNFATGFAVYHDSSNAPTLVKWDVSNLIKTNTSGLNAGAAWSAATTIATMDINWLTPMGGSVRSDQLVVFTDEGRITFTAAGAVAHENPGRDTPYASFGFGAHVWSHDQSVVFPIRGGLGKWNAFGDTTYQTIYPPKDSFGTSANVGQPQYVTGDENHLYISILNSASDYRLLRGTRIGWEPNGEEIWSWDWGVDLGANACDAMAITYNNSAANPWLVFRRGASARYIILPRAGMNALTDGNATFADNGTVIMPWLDANLFERPKAVNYLRCVGFNVGATENIVPAYVRDSGGNPEGLTFTGTSVWQSGAAFEFTVPASTTMNKIMTRFALRRGTTTTATPALQGYAWHTTVRGPARQIRRCTVLCDDRLTLTNGAEDASQTGASIETALRLAMDQTRPLRVGDWHVPKQTFYANLIDLRETYLTKGSGGNTKGRKFQRVFELTLVDATEALSDIARYGRGFRYNQDRHYARAN